MPFHRSYRGRRGKRRHRRKYSNSHASSATKIQRRWRQRRKARSQIHRSMTRYAARKMNYRQGKILYKTFTILLPDYMITTPSVDYPNQGIVCASNAGLLTEVFECGPFLKDPGAVNGVSPICNRFTRYLTLYKQFRTVRAKISLLKYAGKQNDQAYPVQTAAGSYFGTHQYVNQVYSIVDTGSSQRPIIAPTGTPSLTDLTTPPATNLYSDKPDDYFAISNASFKQIAWDKHKSMKYHILKPSRLTEWSQQRLVLLNPTGIPITNNRLSTPWIDSRLGTQVATDTVAAPANANYANMYALTRMPPLSLYGSGFPVRVETIGASLRPVEFPLFKVIMSVTVAFRVPSEDST